MATHNQVRAETEQGSLTVTNHSLDAPLLPVADMERLHHFRPDLVDFVIEQSRIEAETRRSELIRANDNVIATNRYVFIENILGKIFALLIAVLGVGGGVYAGIQGHDWLGGTIATVTIGTLAVAYLSNKKN